MRGVQFLIFHPANTPFPSVRAIGRFRPAEQLKAERPWGLGLNFLHAEAYLQLKLEVGSDAALTAVG